MSTKINWHIPRPEMDTVILIAKRAAKMAADYGIDYPQSTALMDVTACHANGNPLRLAELALADDGNFAHDVFGIRRHINRETGRLEDCFSPRYTDNERANYEADRFDEPHQRAHDDPDEAKAEG